MAMTVEIKTATTHLSYKTQKVRISHRHAEAGSIVYLLELKHRLL